ncbi:acyltransferase [Streptomyces sp. AC495_CC817]|uniref:acyltransferase family protein n=1 Tax=Streptomyces sp. AC495_CC817 TaxID=2823900 RepID=UPI001C254D95|nr:acyltransferase [Streptomyces sp. AC495_CC817]
MAIVYAPPAAAPSAPRATGRDTGVDLIRAVCVAGVVLLHAIMVGVTVSDSGPVFANASDGAWWIVPVSWLLQVMPLFFIIGGFAGVIAYRRQRDRGATASAFVAARVHRLLRPAVVVVGVVGVVLAVLSLAGVSPELVAIAGFRYGQPLWFLAVFLLCQALLPALSALHDRAPLRTLALLAAAALAVDGVRAATGLDGIGFVNLAFVWLTLQQLGFFFADGTVDALSRRVRGAIVAGAGGLLLFSFATGVYSPDLIANINPPTGALLLVGMVHLGLLSLFRERIAQFSRRPRVAAVSAFVNRRTMTIYLWHMPVLLLMAGASAIFALSTGVALPEPSTAMWWIGRPLWLATALALTAVAALALSRFEEAPAPALSAEGRRTAAAALVGVLAVVLLLVTGTTPLTAAIAVVAIVIALRLASAPRPLTWFAVRGTTFAAL